MSSNDSFVSRPKLTRISACLMAPLRWTRSCGCARTLAANVAAARPARKSLRCMSLLPQRVDEQRAAGGNRDVLPAVHRIRHRSCGYLAADVPLPQELARPRVEREEVAFAPAGEHEIGRGREDAAVGDVAHLELPFELAALRVERLNGAPPFLRRARVDVARPGAERRYRHRRKPSGVLVAGLVLRGSFRVRRRGVHPRRDVEEPGAWTIGRRIPIGRALIVRIDERSFRRCVEHALGYALVIDRFGPVHAHEWLAAQELAARAVERIPEAVPVRPQHHFAWTSLPLNVGEHRYLRRVVIELVMRCE